MRTESRRLAFGNLAICLPAADGLRAAHGLEIAAARLVCGQENADRPATARDEGDGGSHGQQSPRLRAEHEPRDVQPLPQPREALEVDVVAGERAAREDVEVEVTGARRRRQL